MTTYVSYSLPQGAQATSDGKGYAEDAISVGTLSTNATSTVELRVDVSTVTTLTRREIDLILQAFRRRLIGDRFGASDFGMI
jgi:hypothetical protein